MLLPHTLPQSAGADASGFVADDFFAGLDDSRWQVVDPVGDGSVTVSGAGTADARLAISVPSGTVHDAWGKNTSVRVLQEVPDADFDVAADFESVPAGTYADQGIQVHGTTAWLRLGVYSKDTKLLAFAAVTTGTSSTKLLQVPVTAGPDGMWLRVRRTGTVFTFSYSPDGVAWTDLGSTSQDLVVTSLGPYAGNAGSSPPAHTALVDVIQDPAAPIDPEDGGEPPPPDTTAPLISDVAVVARSSSADLTWTTDEPTTGRVDYGTGPDLGLTVDSPVSATAHGVSLSGLVPETTYYYRITAQDAAGNASSTGEATFTTSAGGPPEIDLWHSGTLTIGADGLSQPWANILGNASDPSGIAALTYTLNGGTALPLNLGPDDKRLQAPGDFNADLETADLRLGDNTVVLTATDNDGDTAQVTTTVRLESVPAPTLPFTQTWAAGEQVQDQATVVDGLWEARDDGLVPLRLGYDRLVALGDLSWQDYEVRVPFTVRSIGPEAGTGDSGAALVGLALRWVGHNGIGSYQPAWKYFPVGAYVWCRFYPRGPKVEILGNENKPHVKVSTTFTFGEPYWMRARVQTLGDGTTRYAVKMWRADQPEPVDWTIDTTSTGPGNGSVGLIAHHVDVSFGTVEVTPLG